MSAADTNKKTLTAHLVSLPRLSSLYERATSTHPFLVAAQNGTLSSELLGFYLGQDRIYAAYAYPRFIAGLIRKTNASPVALQAYSVDGDDSAEEIHKSVLPLLSKSLEGVVREFQFFDQVAESHKLVLYGSSVRDGLARPPFTNRAATRNYVSEMAHMAEWNDSWEEGIVFLWAMEKVYLDAWTLVRDKIKAVNSSIAEIQSSVVEPLAVLSENWSSPSFITFVGELENLVDTIGRRNTKIWRIAEDLFARVLELEVAFWPMAEELGNEVNRQA